MGGCFNTYFDVSHVSTWWFMKKRPLFCYYWSNTFSWSWTFMWHLVASSWSYCCISILLFFLPRTFQIEICFEFPWSNWNSIWTQSMMLYNDQNLTNKLSGTYLDINFFSALAFRTIGTDFHTKLNVRTNFLNIFL